MYLFKINEAKFSKLSKEKVSKLGIVVSKMSSAGFRSKDKACQLC